MKSMKKKAVTTIIITILIVSLIIIGMFLFVNNSEKGPMEKEECVFEETEMCYSVYPDNPQVIGPLTINKTHYLIGENIFMSMNLNPMEVGYVSLYSHENKLMYKFKFNGSSNPNISQYFRPTFDKISEVCTIDDLVGTWTAKITGVTIDDSGKNLTREPKELKLTIIDEIVRDDDRYDVSPCDI
jgi:hypothetical protein